MITSQPEHVTDFCIKNALVNIKYKNIFVNMKK